MINSALVEILKTFRKEEMKNFHEFISSPYFNKKSAVVRLFNQIKKYSPEFDHNNLVRENLWKYMFPDKEYNYGVMKNLIHELTKLAEQFISISYYSAQENISDINILKFLNERPQSKLTVKYLEKAAKRLENSSQKDAGYFRNKFEIEKIRIAALYNRLSDKHTLKSITEFEESGTYLMESFLIQILEHYVMISNINKIHKTSIETPLLDELLAFIKNNGNFLENFYIKIYYYIILLDREQDEKYYFILKEIFTGLGDNFSTPFKYSIYENISNYVSFRYHAGDHNVLKEQFALYKLSLNKKLYSIENEDYFFANNFITYINVALSLNELSWAEDFVNEYSAKLDPKAREDIMNFCFASISIRKKDFSTASEYLSKIKKLHEPQMKCGLKMMTLITYYEMEWYEAALSVTDSFKHLLDNDKNIQEVIKEKYRKFIRAYLILLDLKNNNDEELKYKYKKYIQETKEINSMAWLTRKARDLGITED